MLYVRGDGGVIKDSLMSSFACTLMENHFTFTTYRELKYFSASCQIVEQNDSSNYINVFNLEQRIGAQLGQKVL